MAEKHPDMPAASPLGQQVGLVLGPLGALGLLAFADLEPGNPAVTRAAAVAFLMATWWISEAIPLAATSLVPVVAFPALGVLDGKAVASTYFNWVIFLFLGGFLVALAMERWELHRRIALRILMLSGAHPLGILFGFMAATAFLSMWISNTATTMMMIPIVLAVVAQLERDSDGDIERYSVGLLLGVAYAASVGGIATLVGTPPNVTFARMFNILFPEAPEISFAQWFAFGLPLSLLLFATVWSFLAWKHGRHAEGLRIRPAAFRKQRAELGPMRFEEGVVLVAFLSLVFLWLFRKPLELPFLSLPGWSQLFPEPSFINDGSVAMFVALLLFLVPSPSKKGGRILDWKTASRIPWHVVLLFGGGFALAKGFQESGLATWVGERLSGLSAVPPFLLVILLCLLVTFLTELTSNTATTEMLLPVLAGLAVAIDVHPLLLMVPATLSASCAFMLPVATPPNAIVFGTERLRISDMARTGLVLNLVGALLVTAATFLIGKVVLGIGDGSPPPWASAP